MLFRGIHGEGFEGGRVIERLVAPQVVAVFLGVGVELAAPLSGGDGLSLGDDVWDVFRGDDVAVAAVAGEGQVTLGVVTGVVGEGDGLAIGDDLAGGPPDLGAGELVEEDGVGGTGEGGLEAAGLGGRGGVEVALNGLEGGAAGEAGALVLGESDFDVGV
ncbi:pectin lyase-like superfamily protein [Striga asiatica]|uniref:Pectin lyase-like superfamily protein n=1 Tax=Striga asiatica TaxID=4170 RepID=A0A5A7P5D1_STRAF|nr:pectin lyase-like superfamily protein [Striga asiatica]